MTEQSIKQTQKTSIKPEAEVVISVSGLKKNFTVGSQEVEVLKGIDFEIFAGDFSVIFGPSGCGKSTLLNTILGLEVPTSGTVKVLDEDIYLNTVEDDRSKFRKRNVGMVYQQANWIKALNIQENVAFPLMLLGQDRGSAIAKALEELERVGMKDWATYQPLELSSGQQQRVALARSMVNDPKLIIADEPTGNLDFQSGQDMMEMLVGLTKLGKTVIMVTHDLEYLKYSTRIVKMFYGQLGSVFGEEDRDSVLEGLSMKRGVGTGADIAATNSAEEAVEKMSDKSLSALSTYGELSRVSELNEDVASKLEDVTEEVKNATRE